ncbi:hypothetical protein TcWFU_002936 [Taenia crassiceps]|uniref:Uncharacterized protein n=1 Tax=Taenia crassiceps TaxID=6207 RepID=A0ABR4QKF0_9CEST
MRLPSMIQGFLSPPNSHVKDEAIHHCEPRCSDVSNLTSSFSPLTSSAAVNSSCISSTPPTDHTNTSPLPHSEGGSHEDKSFTDSSSHNWNSSLQSCINQVNPLSAPTSGAATLPWLQQYPSPAWHWLHCLQQAILCNMLYQGTSAIAANAAHSTLRLPTTGSAACSSNAETHDGAMKHTTSHLPTVSNQVNGSADGDGTGGGGADAKGDAHINGIVGTARQHATSALIASTTQGGEPANTLIPHHP